MKNLLTAITAFCLTFGFLSSTNNDVDVHHLEMPEFQIRPNIQVMEFDVIYIEGQRDDYNFTEDDVSGIDDAKGVIVNDHEFYCQTWPTHCDAK